MNSFVKRSSRPPENMRKPASTTTPTCPGSAALAAQAVRVNLQFSREVLDDSIATLRYGC
jgi:hypothetical protein